MLQAWLSQRRRVQPVARGPQLALLREEKAPRQVGPMQAAWEAWPGKDEVFPRRSRLFFK